MLRHCCLPQQSATVARYSPFRNRLQEHSAALARKFLLNQPMQMLSDCWMIETLDDFVLLKSDVYPTYHLAAQVDDHLMGTTHVLRGEEWLPSVPRHFLVYQAFGWEPPVFAHLSRILGPDRSKLSKRHGAHAALEYREQGNLPDAVVNFLALLGWSLDDHTEIIDRETLIRHFDLDRVLTNPAVFNAEKLLWMNGVYIREMPDDRLADDAAPFLERHLGRPVDRDRFPTGGRSAQQSPRALATRQGPGECLPVLRPVRCRARSECVGRRHVGSIHSRLPVTPATISAQEGTHGRTFKRQRQR